MGRPNGARRVVVTGQGVVSSVGIGVDAFWSSLREGRCGIAQIANFELQDLYITIAGEVKGFDPRVHCNTKPLLLADRYSQFAGAAATEAMKQAGFDGPVPNGHRAASIIGSGIGGLATMETGYVDPMSTRKKPPTR
jgi:nodulation protein E